MFQRANRIIHDSKFISSAMYELWVLRKMFFLKCYGTSLVTQMVKNLPAMWRPRFNPWGSRRFPGERNGYPFQFSFLENTMDTGAWRATVHRGPRVGHDWATNTKVFYKSKPRIANKLVAKNKNYVNKLRQKMRPNQNWVRPGIYRNKEY